MNLDAVEHVLYVIAASFATGMLVALLLGGLKYWNDRITASIQKWRDRDTDPQ
jgi:hypothetical protein